MKRRPPVAAKKKNPDKFNNPAQLDKLRSLMAAEPPPGILVDDALSTIPDFIRSPGYIRKIKERMYSNGLSEICTKAKKRNYVEAEAFHDWWLVYHDKQKHLPKDKPTRKKKAPKKD